MLNLQQNHTQVQKDCTVSDLTESHAPSLRSPPKPLATNHYPILAFWVPKLSSSLPSLQKLR